LHGKYSDAVPIGDPAVPIGNPHAHSFLAANYRPDTCRCGGLDDWRSWETTQIFNAFAFQNLRYYVYGIHVLTFP
jgi:hypothetical protein